MRVPSVQIDRFVDNMEYLALGPFYYSQSGGRCNPEQSGYADCSGAIVDSIRHATGADFGCTGSFDLSRQCHRAGTGISMEEAAHTRGAVLFIGANEGQGALDGSKDGEWPGHVAVSDPFPDGDPRTVEARNHNAGILFGPFWGRFVYAAMPPWFPCWTDQQAPTPAPKPKARHEMIVFYRVPKHPKAKMRDAIWMGDGFKTRHLSPGEVNKWQFIAGSQGVPGAAKIAEMEYGLHKSMEGAS